ncbi:hypothetical protein B0H63DRAFT_140759 [Podospora didyma]|uniref:arginine--tRNA ligase n=1 Tax=Podospora didyma TaxID=330526 RepID=A0AAE0U172_9PEZI|nr:hypothetical protein B0H63DRAFT_140759 [Podospora didyma]
MATRSLPGLAAILRGLGLDAIPGLPLAADVLNRPLDIYHVFLADALHELVNCDLQKAYDAIQPSTSLENGDFEVVLSKLFSDGIAQPGVVDELVQKFPRPHPLFNPPVQEGGHIRLFISPKSLPVLLFPYISDRRSKYGILDNTHDAHSGSGDSIVADPGPSTVDQPAPPGSTTPAPPPPALKKALVEFSSPNLGQDFRTDHLRSTILGGFVTNIYEAMGWQVVRINHLGDWGKEIGLLGLGWIKYGSNEILEKHEDPFRYIHGIYTAMENDLRPELEGIRRKQKRKAREGDGGMFDGGGNGDILNILAERDATFKRLEEGETEAVELWERVRATSVGYYTGTYSRLKVTFDDYSGESLVCRNPEALGRVEKVLRDKGISEERDSVGCVIDFSRHEAGRLGTVALRGTDGITTYFLRDVATVMDRLEDYNFDKMIYVVGEQDLHFRQVFKTIELMGHPEIAAKLHHLTFTRGPPQWGSARLLGDILDCCEDYVRRAATRVHPEQFPPHLCRPPVIRAMSVNSLVLQELGTRNKSHTIGLDVEMLTATEGKTGPSLQLAYSRLCQTLSDPRIPSLREMAGMTVSDSSQLDYSSLWDIPWVELLRLLARFPTVTDAAYRTLEPWTLVSYLFLVVDELNDSFDVVDQEHSRADDADAADKLAARAVLYDAAWHVLENCMRLLNMTPIPR